MIETTWHSEQTRGKILFAPSRLSATSSILHCKGARIRKMYFAGTRIRKMYFAVPTKYVLCEMIFAIFCLHFTHIAMGYECIVFSGIVGINVLLLFDIMQETDPIIGQGITEFLIEQASISQLSPAVPCDREYWTTRTVEGRRILTVLGYGSGWYVYVCQVLRGQRTLVK